MYICIYVFTERERDRCILICITYVMSIGRGPLALDLPRLVSRGRSGPDETLHSARGLLPIRSPALILPILPMRSDSPLSPYAI